MVRVSGRSLIVIVSLPADLAEQSLTAGAVPNDQFAVTWPGVIVCATLLLLYLLLRSTRVVLPAERLVVQHRGTQRVVRPGLRFVQPSAVTRTVPSRIADRHVVAHGVATRDGALRALSVRVSVLADPNDSLREVERDIDISTRRALHTLAAAQPRTWPTCAEDVGRRLHDELAASLARRGHTLIDLGPVRRRPRQPRSLDPAGSAGSAGSAGNSRFARPAAAIKRAGRRTAAGVSAPTGTDQRQNSVLVGR